MQQLYDKGILSSVHKGERKYDLACGLTGDAFLGNSFNEKDPVEEVMVDLASQVVTWRNDLLKLGYPENVWRPLLEELENTQLNLRLKESGRASDPDCASPSSWLLDSSLKRLAAALNRYRQKSHTSLPKIIIAGGYGAGEVGAKVSTEPPGGQVLFIPCFFYELCKAQKLNPDDPDSCDRWREAIDGILVPVIGDYVYVARWADGTTKRGKISVRFLEEGQNIVIRKLK